MSLYPGRYRSRFCTDESSLQRLTLFLDDVRDCFRQIPFGPKILLTAAMCPGTLVTHPTSVFSHCSGCVGFYRAQYSLRLAIRTNHTMNVIATNVQGPQSHLRIVQVSRAADSIASLCRASNFTGRCFSKRRSIWFLRSLGGNIGLPNLL